MSSPTIHKTPIWRRLRFSLMVLVSTVMILLAIMVGLLNSEAGTKWLVSTANKIPGLHIKNVTGTIFSELEIASMRVSTEILDIAVQDIALGVELSCIWQKRICLSKTEIGSINVLETRLQASTAQEKPQSSLTLPLPIQLPEIKLGTLIFSRLDKSQLQLSNLNLKPILISTSETTHLLHLSDIDLHLESLSILLPPSAKNASGAPTQNTVSNTYKSIDPPQDLTSSFDLSHYLQTVTGQIQNAQTHIYTHVDKLFNLQKAYSSTLQNIQLPELQIPINSVEVALLVDSINIMQHDQSPLLEHLTVKLDLILKQIKPGQTEILIPTFTGQHQDFAWTVNGSINDLYNHELTFDAQWFSPEVVSTKMVNPIEHVVWKSSGFILNPTINIATTGLINTNVKIAGDLRKAHVPLDMSINWAPFQYSYQNIQVALGAGFLRANSHENTFSAAFDIPLKTLVFTDTQSHDATPEIQLNDIFSRCAITLELTQMTSQDCSLNFASNPYNIQISGTPDTGIQVETALQIDDIAALTEWVFNGKKLSQHLTAHAVDVREDSALKLSTNTTIGKDKLQLTAMVTLDGVVAQGMAIDDFNTALEVSADVSSLRANLGQTQVQLALPKTHLHITLAPSLFSLDYAQGLLQTSALDISLASAAYSTSQNQASTTTHLIPLGTIQFAPLTLYSSEPTLMTQLSVDALNLQSMFDFVQRVVPSPILANLQTDSVMTLQLNASLLAKQALKVQLGANLSQSTWEYDNLGLTLSPAQLTGDMIWDISQPISTLTGSLQTEVSGDRLGKIALEIERTEQTKLYAELFSVNLGVFAPFVPQFKNLAGLASANLALVQNASDIDITGVVIIPELAINIEKLPESAKTPHPDIQFTTPLEHVFDTQNQDSERLNITTNVNVFVDPLKQNTVTLSALDFASALNGYVNVSGNIQSPLVMGEINIVDGSYAAYGQDLLIRKGSLNFTGPVNLPYVDIEAIRNPKNMADSTIAGLQITGNPNQLKASLFSEPMLENPNILSYLIRGKGLDASSDEDNSVLLTNALLGFGLGRSEDTVSKIGDAFGVDDLQFATQGSGEQTQIGVSGKLNDRLSIEYRVGVFSAITEFGLRYQWLPNLYLEATSGASNALDVFYEIKWGERAVSDESTTKKNNEASAQLPQTPVP